MANVDPLTLYKDSWCKKDVELCEQFNMYYYSPWSIDFQENQFICHSKYNEEGFGVRILVCVHNGSGIVKQINLEVGPRLLCSIPDKLDAVTISEFVRNEAILRLKYKLLLEDKKEEQEEEILTLTCEDNLDDYLWFGGCDNFKEKLREYEVRLAERNILKILYSLDNEGTSHPSGAILFERIKCPIDILCISLNNLWKDTYVGSNAGSYRPSTVLGLRYNLLSDGRTLVRDKARFNEKYPDHQKLANDIFEDKSLVGNKDITHKLPDDFWAHYDPVAQGKVEHPYSFVIMPFKDNEEGFERVYESMQRASEDAGLRGCIRVDEDLKLHQITNKIIGYLRSADIIIADVTGRNPNVFYELGFAHALRKPVVFITQDRKDMPFDVDKFPNVEYKLNDLGAMTSQLRDIIKDNLPTR